MNANPTIAIAGATGAVGEEILKCLIDLEIPVGDLKLLASARSAGKTIAFKDKIYTIEELTEHSFAGVDIAFFSAGGGLSEKFAPIAAAAGAIVIDNSSAFRMDDEVPLVVPEINPEALKNIPKGIIANPNCTTIISLMALFPLHEKYGLKSIIASSYQAVSGSGAEGIAELEQQTKAVANGTALEDLEKSVYLHPIACNVIPHVDVFKEGGYTKEELKMLHESRKILGLPELKVTCTCVRVPVTRSHSVSITATFENKPTVSEAQGVFAKYPGIQLCDDIDNLIYPMPYQTTLKQDCLVGRIREDLVLDNSLALWVVGDQVLKGAALNAVQIAQKLISG